MEEVTVKVGGHVDLQTLALRMRREAFELLCAGSVGTSLTEHFIAVAD